MSRSPLIVDIKANSLDDGPGIRSVVFFKGCPLSCLWCHNPESIAPGAELSWDPDICVEAGACVRACPENALEAGRLPFIDRHRCSACLACVDACPSGAFSRVGEAIDVDDLTERLLRDKPFYDNSGGGVTVSGGEATWAMSYLGRLLQRLAGAGVHTLLETCGAFSRERFRREAYPWLDLIYYDLKVADSVRHRELCGVDNRKIFENFAWLQEMSACGGVEVLPRVPLVPGLTDTDANLDALAAFLVAHDASRVELMTYNPLWGAKAEKLGHSPAYAGRWMGAEELERCARRFQRRGVEVVSAESAAAGEAAVRPGARARARGRSCRAEAR